MSSGVMNSFDKQHQGRLKLSDLDHVVEKLSLPHTERHGLCGVVKDCLFVVLRPSNI